MIIQPGQTVNLEYVMSRGNGTSLPWSYMVYYWEVTDADGNRYQSEWQSFRYDDIRFDWQVLQNDDISVWWHDRPNAFGQDVFDIAVRAVRDQRDFFQVNLEFPIRIVIYNTFGEYAEWRGGANEWVGGETYSDYGVTVQIVENTFTQKAWLNDVIPHEISHLYFAQATQDSSSIPYWINEGVAQYNEYDSNLRSLRNAQNAAKSGDLIPLSKLENGFGGVNVDRVYLAYDESLSAVKYLADTYGAGSLGALLQAYNQGLTTDEAFISAIGIDAGAFESQWAKNLGVPDDYVTATPWPFPTFPSPPTMVAQGQVVPTQDPTLVPDSTPTDIPDAPTPSGTRLPCTSFAPVLALGLGTLIYRRKRNNYV